MKVKSIALGAALGMMCHGTGALATVAQGTIIGVFGNVATEGSILHDPPRA
jgi:hypothetical protein